MNLNINNSDKMVNKKNIKKSIELIHEKPGYLIDLYAYKK